MCKRWKKWWIWHVLFAHIVPLPLTIHILFSRGLYVPLDRYNPGIEKVPILLYYDLWELDINIITIILNSVCLLICFCLNLATFIKVKKIKKQNPITIVGNVKNKNNNASGGISKPEINLIIMTAVMTAMLTTSLLYQLLYYLLKDGKPLATFLGNNQNIDIVFELLWNQLPWVNDLRALSHPWLLVALCEDVRQKSVGGLLRVVVGKTWKTKVEPIQSVNVKTV
uniref:Serpentine receptor class gamma n=1 Tax=Meloidogyne incognita TaxID=6306 RepID=A0A914MYY7_MELIC